MEVKKIVEGMTAPQVAQVIDENFKAQNAILEEDIAKQNNVIGVSEYKDFSEAEAVNVGDVRKYEGFLYECVEATQGAWDASKWKKSSFKKETETKLSELAQAAAENYGLFSSEKLNRIIKELVVGQELNPNEVSKVAIRKAYLASGRYYNNVYLYTNTNKTIVVHEETFSTREAALSATEEGLKIYSTREGYYALMDFTKVVEDIEEQAHLNYSATIVNAPTISSVLNKEFIEQNKNRILESASQADIAAIFNEICREGVNLFNKNSDLIKKGYWGYTSTGFGFIEDNSIRSTHPISLREGVTYKCHHSYSTFGSNTMLAAVDNENNAIKPFVGIESNGFLLFTPTESGLYSFNIGSSENVDSYMVAEESIYPDRYTPYEGIKIKKDLVEKRSTDFWKYEEPINLFNKNSTLIKVGFWGYRSDGTYGLTENNGYYITHPIYLTKGTTYKYIHPYSSLGTNLSVARVNVLNIYIGHSQGVKNGDFLLFTPTESGYYSFNLGSTDLNTIVVAKADNYPSMYEPYFEPYWTLPDLKIKEAADNVDINPLYGKAVAFDGDSICQGAGASGGYGKIIAERNNMIYQNRGVGGGTITAETYSSVSGAARHWISRDIQNLNADADYIILEGGVNDSSLKLEIGEITSDYTSSFDDTTFCGAMESMLKQTIERFKGKKIGFIIVHKMTNTYNSEVKDWLYYDKTIQACKKWGIPYIDLNVECPPLGYISSLKEQYTADSDGWHPNEEGYKKYYCDKIEAWMKTL